VRVVLVDADFDQPLLANRLGLLPEVGWDDVLWRGLPLSEAVIESVEDRLAVLPLRGTSQSDANGVADPVDPTSDIDLLRRQYDVALIDLGRFDGSSAKAAAVLQSANHWIGAVVVVHNVCTERPTEVEQLRRRLRQQGLAEAGIAENFV
jgi:MinD-like ATPase involved in chromosome partitioning or flagellar assembly